jgi:hypothetical protein
MKKVREHACPFASHDADNEIANQDWVLDWMTELLNMDDVVLKDRKLRNRGLKDRNRDLTDDTMEDSELAVSSALILVRTANLLAALANFALWPIFNHRSAANQIWHVQFHLQIWRPHGPEGYSFP